MATKAFQKIYTKITQITKATCSLKATGYGGFHHHRGNQRISHHFFQAVPYGNRKGADLLCE